MGIMSEMTISVTCHHEHCQEPKNRIRKRQQNGATMFKQHGVISRHVLQIFFVMTVVLLLQAQLGHCSSNAAITDPALEEDILAQFPGLFHTREEMEATIAKEFPGKGKPRKPGKLSPSIASIDSPLVEPIDRPSGSSPMTIYHGCCISEVGFTDYKELPNREGKMVQLIEFLKKKQYFQTETCKTDSNCNMCSCAMENRYFTALIVNPLFPDNSPHRRVLEMVSAPTVCRCYNNLSLSSSRSALHMEFMRMTMNSDKFARCDRDPSCRLKDEL